VGLDRVLRPRRRAELPRRYAGRAGESARPALRALLGNLTGARRIEPAGSRARRELQRRAARREELERTLPSGHRFDRDLDARDRQPHHFPGALAHRSAQSESPRHADIPLLGALLPAPLPGGERRHRVREPGHDWQRAARPGGVHARRGRGSAPATSAIRPIRSSSRTGRRATRPEAKPSISTRT